MSFDVQTRPSAPDAFREVIGTFASGATVSATRAAFAGKDDI